MYFIKSFCRIDRSLVEETPSSPREKKKKTKSDLHVARSRIKQFSGTDHWKENIKNKQEHIEKHYKEQKDETMSCKPRQSCKFRKQFSRRNIEKIMHEKISGIFAYFEK